jgi:hypothetical protein
VTGAPHAALNKRATESRVLAGFWQGGDGSMPVALTVACGDPGASNGCSVNRLDRFKQLFGAHQINDLLHVVSEYMQTHFGAHVV